MAEFSAWYDAHKADKTAPYRGVPQVVDALKAAGVTVAVLSNKADALAESVVEGYYPGVFAAVQGALPDVPTKPDPTLLNKLMEQLGADRAHTLFVGDSNVDIQTGQERRSDQLRRSVGLPVPAGAGAGGGRLLWPPHRRIC